jgi:hypothetical protein
MNTAVHIEFTLDRSGVIRIDNNLNWIDYFHHRTDTTVWTANRDNQWNSHNASGWHESARKNMQCELSQVIEGFRRRLIGFVVDGSGLKWPEISSGHVGIRHELRGVRMPSNWTQK